MGTASTTYVSVPDPAATSTAGTNCASLGLPALPSGWSYHCAASSTYRLVNGTGWIPLDFTQISFKSPLALLPVDPVNSTSNGNYYTYTPGGSWELTALAESQRYRSKYSGSPVPQPGVFTAGSDLALSPLFNTTGLVGYWTFDEGNGSTASDQSGNGNAGTWNGSGSHWATGKVGSAGQFNGTNDYVGVAASVSIQGISSYTVAAWINMALPGTNYNPIFCKESGVDVSDIVIDDSGSGVSDRITFSHNNGNGGTPSSGEAYTNPAIPANVWAHIAVTYSGGTVSVFINGALLRTFTGVNSPLTNNSPVDIGRMLYSGGYRHFFSGKMDDMRLYNRALSAAEVTALYNATK